MRVVPLDETTIAAWEALFAACGCSCFCRYWHFAGGKSEWLERTFTAPERGLAEQRELVAQKDPSAMGLIALDPDDPLRGIGWMKLAPRDRMTKVLKQGPYRSLVQADDPGTGLGTWVIGCLLVHPSHRGRGVARRLIAAADDHVRAWGGSTLQAYPRGAAGTTVRLHDEEAWMGTDALFASLGYVRVAGEPAYPLYSKKL